MGIFPGFGVWINQNNQQPPKAESKKPKNVKSKPGSEINTNAESEGTKKQLKLWKAYERKIVWQQDITPEVKGIESSKVHRDNGRDEKVVVVKKIAPWKFLRWKGEMPIDLVFNENRKDLIISYKTPKKGVMHMERFLGQLQIKPWYVDSDKYCTAREPKNAEEYRKCSGGKGLLASNLTLDQVYMPMSPLDKPPFSWYIQRVITEKTKSLMEELQIRGAVIRSV
ncbi:unnamed protein product [Eruca vesicaria subsp. sativa]|uniref:DUF220 domain-containing protein n=1 Tax=Eruca vesicaria subsp. sativa TaxID=29727 RepID=A0ABC8LSW0_ERUVS|nr:unnamed protein product [Eruca vesicaria subsp. sativa]